MQNIKKASKKSYPAFRVVAVFVLCMALFVFVIYFAMQSRSENEKLTMEKLITEKSIRINEVISRLLQKTETLAAFITQRGDELENFDQLVESLMDDPAILNMLSAPGGVVQQVYPLAGNEGVLGLDFFSEGAGNLEAIKAKELRQLVFGGPFTLVQGGEALVGRLPVFLADGSFWGLVSVTLKHPEALAGASLDLLEMQGYAYEVWRVNPDDGQRQVIAASEMPLQGNYVEKHIPLLNADWYFRAAPLHDWHQYSETWILLFVALGVSLLIAYIIHSNYVLKKMQYELTAQIHIDTLTGIRNEQGLIHEMERLVRLEKRFYFYRLDIGRYQQICASHGKEAGDMVLKEFTRRVDRHADGSHILGHLGGGRFALVHVSDLPYPEKMNMFWVELNKEMSTPFPLGEGNNLLLTFDTGEAAFPRDSRNIRLLMAAAEKNLQERRKNPEKE